MSLINLWDNGPTIKEPFAVQKGKPTAGTFKYTTPIRVPFFKVVLKVAVRGRPPWQVEFAVEVAELALPE